MRKIYFSDSFDPYHNLAIEEYLLNHSDSDDQILFLWQNENTVVIGRNQNPWKECNLEELESEGCKLVRRLSGGGAVYHDLGNLNFTFISTFDTNRIRQNIEVVIGALKTYELDAKFSGKNDIMIGASKVSGNAYLEKNGMLCHHGTLLINTDIGKLSKLLTVSKLKLESKGIDSVSSRVMNLKDLNAYVTVENLKETLAQIFLKNETNLTALRPTVGDIIKLEEFKVLKQRFASQQWNFGSTPEFDVCLSGRYEWGEVELNLNISDGTIREVKISTDSVEVDLPLRIRNRIINTAFDEKGLLEVIIPSLV